ncbi:MAG: toll/interleukin-1 receptor domain-containing protein [Hyphomonadaceae bacterium]|nr:toll/interleukin-1 receptor domain-containing protein [Hyphomonadaceae bacterium]
MQVFISWSGQLSKAIAGTLATWLPTVLQSVRTYYTPNDTEKGSRWFEEIAQQLEASAFGIVVLTKSNLEKPWIHFEAGALISRLERKVTPLLIQVSETDLKPPLSLLNATFLEKEDIRRLVSNINEQFGEKRVPSDAVDRVFDKFWPDLLAAVESHILETRETARPPSSKRDQSEVLEELVSIVRDLQRRPHSIGSSGATLTSLSRRLISTFTQLTGSITDDIDREECLNVLSRVCEDYWKIVDKAQVEERALLLEQLDRVRRSIVRAKDEIPF